MPLITDEKLANRRARVIASDIKEYNEEKVNQGVKRDNLWEALSHEIQEGLESYREAVSAELFEKHNFYHRALVDVLLRGRAHIPSKIW